MTTKAPRMRSRSQPATPRRDVPNPRQPPLDWPAITTFTYHAEPRRPQFQFSHDEQKRLFVLTMPDGKIEPPR